MTGDQTICVDGRPIPAPYGGIRLLDWLREEIGNKGPKEGCGMGHCGACTVVVDDRPVLACCVLAATLGGCRVKTSVGLTRTCRGRQLQEAFTSHGAAQCGFCMPGMLVASLAWIENGGQGGTDETDLRKALSGNICRCSGYTQIVTAVLEVAANR